MSEEAVNPSQANIPGERDNMSELASQINELSATADDVVDINADPRLEATLDVPESSFWDNVSEGENTEEEPQLEADDSTAESVEEATEVDVPDVSDDQIIKYKANS